MNPYRNSVQYFCKLEHVQEYSLHSRRPKHRLAWGRILQKTLISILGLK